jgi:thiopeptide-type bacteriocin biosynthesis protein
MWLRYDLDAAAPHPDLYATLSGTAAMLLHGGTAAEVFFVHTPAGIRLRCRAAEPNIADVAWQATLLEAHGRGLLTAWRPAPYEPFGFGGPDAMAAAHRVFTADSLAWLEFHARAARPVPTVSRWAASLLMIRTLVEGLRLSGWEVDDLGDRIFHSARRLRTPDPTDPTIHRLSVALRAAWDEPDQLRDRLDAFQPRLLAAYEAAVRPAALDWRNAQSPALRHGVALAILFHWNRSGMPVSHQQVLATTLSRLYDQSRHGALAIS